MLNQAFGKCGVESEHAKGENMSCTAALPYIKDGISIYNLTSRTQTAFYLFTLAKGSENLSYNTAVFSNETGKGTRAMMTAKQLHAFLKDSSEVLKAHPELEEYAKKDFNEADNDGQNKTLTVLKEDKYTFLPGAWWIRQGADSMYAGCKGFAANLTNKITMEQFDKIDKQCMMPTVLEGRRETFRKAFDAIKCGSSKS
ncbi:hypothetical protein DSO57_1007158 [Entomophthora muscae]|uniref:Uncharacterized protein n=1 Tax=Entomophthora muscae TaxID=34485 RepID=A0ACC2U537_9FUNG|nr:hypothetical protein DSO57_1007158 [Entomophthora muscae]